MKKAFLYSKIVIAFVTICLVLNSNKLLSQCVTAYPYAEGFESGPTWTVAGTNSDWAWGTPAHPTINTTGGGTKSWVVGGLTGSFYNFSEQAGLYSPCFDFTTLNYPWISLKIFWEDEWKWDGLVLQSSINGGATWQNVGAFGDAVDCNTANWYTYNNITWLNSLPAAQRHGWTGRIGPTVGTCAGGNGSGGWILAKHCLVGLANQSNVLFRFLFGSGTTCNSYDGIAIDDITISNGIPHAPTFTVNCNNFTAINPPCPVVSSYTWNFGDPLSGPSNTSALANPSHVFSGSGTYSVTLSVSGGQCNPPASITQTVSVNSFTPVPISQSITCFGLNNGSGTVSALGVGPFTYTWLPTGGNSSTASNLPAGTYSVQINDANNCTVTKTLSIIQPPALTAPITTSNVLCNGGSTGSATVTAGGGTPGYTYTWSPTGGNSATATNLTAGSYTVLVKDANNCTVTAITNIIQPSALSTTISSNNASCGINNGSATVNVSGGSPAYTYTWSPAGGNASTASVLTAGNYTVLIKDANNCTVTAVTVISQPNSPTVTVSSNSILCNGGTGSATAAVTGGNPLYSYTWSPAGGNSSAASNLTVGTYTILVKDASNCTVTAVANITQPTALTVPVTSSSVLCNGSATGSATVTAGGGTPGYTYTWSPTGGNTSIASGLGAGTYTVLVKDANNCTVTAVTNIIQPTLLTATVTSGSILCNGGTTTATVTAGGGTPGYTYTWSPTGGNGNMASNLTAGTYTLLLKDANNCTLTVTSNIIGPPPLTTTINAVGITCFGAANGSASVLVGGGTPGYTYTWSPSGGNSSTANGLTPGTYTVTIKDANNCIVTAITPNITQPSALTASIATTNANCGASNGSATVTASGGVPAYSYVWTSSASTSSIAAGLAAGNYTVTVMDIYNCSITATATVNQPISFTSTMNVTNATCNGSSNGTASVTINGGVSPYSYTWSPAPGAGQGTSFVSGLAAGVYTVTAADVNNCGIKLTATITQPAALTTTNVSSNVSCNGGANGSTTVTVSGGTAGYTYNWNPSGGTSSTAVGLSAGSYTVVVTDVNSCTVAAMSVITEPAIITTTISSANITCNGAANGSATITVAGGTPGYTYTWSPGGGNAASTNGLTANTFTVSIKDIKNCLTTTVVTITQPPVLTAITTQTNITCFGANNGAGSIQANGGTSPYTYSWSPVGNTTMAINNLSNGSYTCFITDNNNCKTSKTINISQPPILVASTFNYSVCSGSATTVSSSAIGGVVPYAFNWNGGLFTGQTFTDNPSVNTTYTLIVTDNNGCASSSVVSNVSVYTQPTVSVSGNNSICAGNSSVLSASIVGAAGNVNYLWTPGSFTTPVITVTPATTVVYQVNINSAGLCPLNSQNQVTVVVHPNPVVSSNNSAVIGCAPLCVTFTDNSTTPQGTITAWGWNFTNGQGSVSQNPTICFNEPGTFKGDHTAVNSFGCSTTIKDFVTITVYPKPVADFNHSPIKPIINVDGEVVFTDASWGAPIISWNWYFMNTAQYTSTLQNPTFVYTEAGTYVVALVVKSDKGCIDTLLRPLVVGEDFGLYVPNAFTPNEDGINDGFQPKGFGIVKYELYIFDRWGEKLFQTKTFEEAWNGTYQGRGTKICEEAVYTWLINATDVFGKAHELKGHVTLIK